MKNIDKKTLVIIALLTFTFAMLYFFTCIWDADDESSETATPSPVAEPTATPKPTVTPEAAGRTRDNPFPFGVPAEVKFDETDHWEITVLGTVPNATSILMGMDDNSYEDPPGEGNQFYMAIVRAKYLGSDSVMFSGGSMFRVVGEGGVVYTTFDNDCPTFIPDKMSSYIELFTNGTMKGAVCWNIASSDADSLIMMVDSDLPRRGYDRAWFALK